MKLGISSYTFTWAAGVRGSLPENRLNAAGVLDNAKELGISLVQIADNMPLHSMPDDEIKVLIQKAETLGIEIETGANKMTAENLEVYIRIAGRLGSKILRFAIDGEGYHPDPDEIIPVIRNAVPELRSRNITLALENHDRLFASDFTRLIEAVDSPLVGICLDCANSLGIGEGFHEVVAQLAPYTVNFHLKEVFIKRKYHMMGFDVEGRPFGEGCLPLKWMLEQLPSKCKTAILEQWTPPEDNIMKTIEKEREWASKSIAYLKPFFV